MMGDGEYEFHRLGKRELGRHAFEDRMPAKIARLVASENDENTVTGAMGNLARLLDHDGDVAAAFLCNDRTPHVHKIPDEGHHFCGYRNIQMLCLALGLSGHSSAVPHSLRQKLTIPQIQDLIETAWNNGINAHARIQTGGIKNTRKDIGTSEAEAFLLGLSIACTGKAFVGKGACGELFDFVEEYFTTPVDPKSATGVHRTNLQPIFLQRPRHSITIVGFERTVSGKRRLLTFDPSYQAPSNMGRQLTESECSGWSAQRILWRYRKGEKSLRRFTAFETLTIDKCS